MGFIFTRILTSVEFSEIDGLYRLHVFISIFLFDIFLLRHFNGIVSIYDLSTNPNYVLRQVETNSSAFQWLVWDVLCCM